MLPVGTPTNNTERATSGHDSGDDPDLSFVIERGDPLFDAGAAPSEAADGMRLAHALGVDPASFEHVANAGGRDVTEAQLFNRALWPATLGNYLEEMFGSLFPTEIRDWIAEYALGNVTARGMVPSVKIGNQPYGILPTTALTRYVPATGEARFDNGPGTDVERRALFNRLMRDVLLRMNEDWTALRITHVKHAHSTRRCEFSAALSRYARA